MISVDLILLMIAAVCFGLAAIGWNPWPRGNFVALGLFCWVLTVLI